MEKLQELAKQKWVQLLGALALGITVGAVFYPQSKTVEKTKTEMKEEYEAKEKITQEEHQKTVSSLQDKLDAEEKSHTEFEKTTTQKLESLTSENTQLKSSSRKTTFKLVKPDGTVVEKTLDESNSESTKSVITQVRTEFDEKVKSIEDKWKKIHEDRVAQMQSEFDAKVEKIKSEQKTTTVTVEKEKTVETNPKKLRPEIGITTNRDIYLHGTYSLWGPVFLGGGVSGTTHSFGEGRLGLGVEF